MRMGLIWDKAQAAALNREDRHWRVAQCVHNSHSGINQSQDHGHPFSYNRYHILKYNY